MILIVTSENDKSTQRVVNWLLYYSIKYIIITEMDFLLKISLSISNNKNDFDIKLENGKQFRLSEIKAYWYRRGQLNKKPEFLPGEKLKVEKENHLYNEWRRLQNFLHKIIEKKDGIGNFEISNYFNKLYQLAIAKEIGFNIPETLVSNETNALSKFIGQFDIVVTKNIEREFYNKTDKMQIWANRTNIINEININNLGNSPSFPSLIQEGILKKYELRIFYLERKCWSMCIIHDNSNSHIDYRESKNLRMVPYKIPLLIQEKINHLMDEMGLNCGSLDLLVDKTDEYYFLEVNPVGQYDFLSQYCNYYLHREIASFFKNIIAKNEK